jgi:hypothetical protein
MLDCVDQECQIVLFGRQIQLLNPSLMHRQTTLARKFNGSGATICSFQPPGTRAKFTEKSQMKTVTAPNVDYSRVRLKPPAPSQKSLGLQSAADMEN